MAAARVLTEDFDPRLTIKTWARPADYLDFLDEPIPSEIDPVRARVLGDVGIDSERVTLAIGVNGLEFVDLNLVIDHTQADLRKLAGLVADADHVPARQEANVLCSEQNVTAGRRLARRGLRRLGNSRCEVQIGGRTLGTRRLPLIGTELSQF